MGVNLEQQNQRLREELRKEILHGENRRKSEQATRHELLMEIERSEKRYENLLLDFCKLVDKYKKVLIK